MNLPNKLTLTRIFLTPIMLVVFLSPIPYGISKFASLFIYLLASLTDLLDGKIARKYNLITTFGKFMDQIADKFIATTALILILFEMARLNLLPLWVCATIVIIVCARDTLVGGIRQVAASKGIIITADIYGKVKSFVLDTVSIILFMFLGLKELNVSVQILMDIIYYVGIVGLVAGAILTLISGINYTIKGAPCLKEQPVELTAVEEEK